MAAGWKDSPQDMDKVDQIRTACRNRDIARLQTLASTEDGLVSDELRREAWPLLLGCSLEDDSNDEVPDWRSLPAHKDEDQVRLDVARSFVHYPDDDAANDSTKDSLKHDLSDLIISTLRRHPCLNYFQGYHDISQVVLLVYSSSSTPPPSSTPTSSPNPLASKVLSRLSLLRLRDFLLPSITGTSSFLHLLPTLLSKDPELSTLLSRSGIATHPFALSATLTMYAHDLHSPALIPRVFDFLLANEAVLSLYMYASIVLQRKRDLLVAAEEEDYDPAVLYAILARLPQDMDWEELFVRTKQLYALYPPEQLLGWRGVSCYSVLRTTRPVAGLRDQTLTMGEKWLGEHQREIGRLEKRREEEERLRRVVKAHAGRVSVVALTVLVAGLAVYFGRRHGQVTGLRELVGVWNKLLGWSRGWVESVSARSR